jgi:hypothetical protein
MKIGGKVQHSKVELFDYGLREGRPCLEDINTAVRPIRFSLKEGAPTGKTKREREGTYLYSSREVK